MSMEMTWLDFQLSTDNQNGRHLAIKIFFDFFFSDFPRNLVYIDFRVRVCESIGIVRFLVRLKTRLWRPSSFFN